MTLPFAEIVLNISGMGIVFYSPSLIQGIGIEEGSDFFSSSYSTEEQVQSHIQKGDLVSFCTGSPGTFRLRFFSGYPEHNPSHKNCEFYLRLGLRCLGGVVCFRDLFDLMDWHSHCPSDQMIELDDGIYHVTLCTDVPESGIIGDDQLIDVYLNKLESYPRLATKGVPTLCL